MDHLVAVALYSLVERNLQPRCSTDNLLVHTAGMEAVRGHQH